MFRLFFCLFPFLVSICGYASSPDNKPVSCQVSLRPADLLVEATPPIEMRPMDDRTYGVYRSWFTHVWAFERYDQEGGDWHGIYWDVAEEMNRDLSQGNETPNHFFFSVFPEEEAEAVGYVWYELKNDPARIHVNDLGVFTRFRRRGLGQAIMKYVAEHAERLGAIVTGHIWGTNETSLALAKSLGAQVEPVQNH